MFPHIPLRELRQGWPWNRISTELAVQVEQNSWVASLVERRSSNSSGQCFRPRALDLEVHTLRVRLRTVALARSMQRNDLVSDDIVSWRQTRGDGGRPREIFSYEVVCNLWKKLDLAEQRAKQMREIIPRSQDHSH